VLKRILTLIDLGFKLKLENEGLKEGLGNKLLFLLFKIRKKLKMPFFYCQHKNSRMRRLDV
jgi:hypothetical protein